MIREGTLKFVPIKTGTYFAAVFTFNSLVFDGLTFKASLFDTSVTPKVHKADFDVAMDAIEKTVTISLSHTVTAGFTPMKTYKGDLLLISTGNPVSYIEFEAPIREGLTQYGD